MAVGQPGDFCGDGGGGLKGVEEAVADVGGAADAGEEGGLQEAGDAEGGGNEDDAEGGGGADEEVLLVGVVVSGGKERGGKGEVRFGRHRVACRTGRRTRGPMRFGLWLRRRHRRGRGLGACASGMVPGGWESLCS